MSTAPDSFAPAVPEQFLHLVDDAAIFPPGSLPVREAVDAHRAHRATFYADLVGPFVVDDTRIPDLIEVLGDEDSERPPLAVTVVVTGGAGALEPAARWAGDAKNLDLRSLEIALRDELDLAHNARRVGAVVDQLLADGHLSEDVDVYVEPPRLDGDEPGHSWLAALDEVAAMDHRLKFRLGGVAADAFPTAGEVAAAIHAALDRELAFKCTAGLHHALRHQVNEGFEHPVAQHGFLNVLLATRASLDGAGPEQLVVTLEEQDAAVVREQLDAVGPAALASARRWFTSFGSCGVLDAVTDLVDLDLLPHPTEYA